eukprot:852338_1
MPIHRDRIINAIPPAIAPFLVFHSIGIGPLFHEWLYDEILDDSSMEVLLKPGVTSLNEACNKLLNGYACKYRFLGGLAYDHSVSRGICQWERPYWHIVTE